MYLSPFYNSVSVVTLAVDTTLQVMKAVTPSTGPNLATPSPTPANTPGGSRSNMVGRNRRIMSSSSTRLSNEDQPSQLSRSWVITLPYGLNTFEMQPMIARCLATSYIVTVPTDHMRNAVTSPFLSSLLGASDGAISLKMGLMYHTSLLATDRNYGGSELAMRMKSSRCMDSDMQGTMVTESERMGVAHHIAAQYNALSWLSVSPVGED
eukprot:Ihof_evm2s456 gene=Ihof_evmTU2s456